jgi:hypothetical protein
MIYLLQSGRCACGGSVSSRADKAVGAVMQQIADWIEKLDLSQYAQCFAENKIDVSVLPHLTDEDVISAYQKCVAMPATDGSSDEEALQSGR